MKTGFCPRLAFWVYRRGPSCPAEGDNPLCDALDTGSVVVFFPVAVMADLCSVMPEAESRAACGLRSLEKAVSELLNRVAEEVLALLEARGGRSLGRLLRLLLSERLAAATERIVGLLEREQEADRRQLERQRRLLDALLCPVVRLGRTGDDCYLWWFEPFNTSKKNVLWPRNLQVKTVALTGEEMSF